MNSGLTGFDNLGNTCYLNTTLQCLSNTMPLTMFFFENRENKYKQNKSSVLVYCFQKLMEEVWVSLPQKKIIRPENFVRVSHALSVHMNKEHKSRVFQIGEQHDMVEYLQFILDMIHDSLSTKVSMNIEGDAQTELDQLMIKSLSTWKKFYENDYSIVVDMFTGQFISHIITSDNGPLEQSNTFDPFNVLQLPIPRKHHLTLYDCFNELVKPEKIDGWVGTLTTTPRRIEKKLNLWKLPTILIIQLKRFHNVHSKNNSNVNFPLELNLEDYCIGYDKHQPYYDLYAIGNHTGGLHGGHYFAICKNINNNWYVYNDNQVHEIPEEHIITPSAYCLFYYRTQKKSNHY